MKLSSQICLASLAVKMCCPTPISLGLLPPKLLISHIRYPCRCAVRIFRKKCGAGSWKFQQALQPHMERFLIICRARRARSVPLSAKTLFPCSLPVTGLSVLQAICMVIDGGRIFKNPYSQPRVRPFQLRFKIIGH